MKSQPLNIVDGRTRGPDGRPLSLFAAFVERVEAGGEIVAGAHRMPRARGPLPSIGRLIAEAAIVAFGDDLVAADGELGVFLIRRGSLVERL